MPKKNQSKKIETKLEIRPDSREYRLQKIANRIAYMKLLVKKAKYESQ
ncbi:MAG TPA: hypothetical protein PLV72_04355 [Candidatus Magasanikbacteria bacterium]|nr:hypothetical protein [Candidatus Magasanikbacteria bacterium]